MKSLLSVLVFLIFVRPFSVTAQTSVIEVIDGIIEQIGHVDLAKISYYQKLHHFSGKSIGSFQLDVTTETSKGKSESLRYIFDLADVDPNSVVRKMDKKAIAVNLGIHKLQPFIMVMKDDQIVGYESSIRIVVEDAESAKSLAYRFTRAIDKLPHEEIQWTSLDEAFSWLVQYESTYKISERIFEESFDLDPDHNHKITLWIKSSQGEDRTTESFEFFPHHLDLRFIRLAAKGEELVIEIRTKNKDKFIKHIRNEELQSYKSQVFMPAENLEIARKIIRTLDYITTNFESEQFSWKNLEETLAWIENSLGSAELTSKLIAFAIKNEVRDQELRFEPKKSFLSRVNISRVNNKGEEELLIEEFYPWQINPKMIRLDVVGNKLFAVLPVTNERKFVKNFKNGIQQPYQALTKIYFTDVHIAEKAISALKYIIPLTQPPELQLESLDDVEGLVLDLGAEFSDGKRDYQLELFFDRAKYQMAYHEYETDKSGEIRDSRIEFYLDDIRGKGIDIEVLTSKMYVPIQTKNYNKHIRITRNGELKNFDSDTKILFNDSKKAHEFIGTIEYLKAHQKADHDWADDTEVMHYISDRIDDLQFPKEQISQSWQFKPENECLISYRRESAGEKNFTELLYEFALSDIDPKKYEIQVNYKKMFIKVVSNGGQKLITNYKNGELQNYKVDMEFLVEDAYEGRMIIDALKYMHDMCQD